MRISASAMDLKSSHFFNQTSSVFEKSRFWAGKSTSTPAREALGAQKIQLLNASQRAAAENRPASIDCQKTSRSDEIRNQDPEMAILCDIIEKLTGKRVRIFSAEDMQQTAPAENALALADLSEANSGTPPAPTPSGAGFGYEYQRHQIYTEQEFSAFSAKGTVKTSDGQTINFNLSVSMSRSYLEESDTQILLGDAAKVTDPLVINFTGTAAQLSDKRFSFDLNADGHEESIPQLASGSGFLALDRNHDGKINNGSELFGPNLGNGFAELATLDDDQNGWIDENDTAFNSLSVWEPAPTPSAPGSLKSLAESGIGAISLQAAQTPFSIKNSHNDLQGLIRASSVFLTETGQVGCIQQVDLVA